MSHPVSLKKAAAMSDANLEEAIEFVSTCVDRGYAYVVQIGERANQDKQHANNSGLMKKLRTRFASKL